MLELALEWSNSYLFVSGSEIYKFKTKDSDIVAAPFCLGNISKDNGQQILTGYVYDFSADYNAIDADDIKGIHNYLVKKNNII